MSFCKLKSNAYLGAQIAVAYQEKIFSKNKQSTLDSKSFSESNSNPWGQIAQSVEQRIENPRVGGSIPSLATNINQVLT
jgi:hypothetical protein